jgi:hypothetical protein
MPGSAGQNNRCWECDSGDQAHCTIPYKAQEISTNQECLKNYTKWVYQQWRAADEGEVKGAGVDANGQAVVSSPVDDNYFPPYTHPDLKKCIHRLQNDNQDKDKDDIKVMIGNQCTVQIPTYEPPSCDVSSAPACWAELGDSGHSGSEWNGPPGGATDGQFDEATACNLSVQSGIWGPGNC